MEKPLKSLGFALYNWISGELLIKTVIIVLFYFAV